MNYKAALLKQNRKIFSTDDLALLWNISNRNTLLTTIKRYLNKNILYSLRKGLYSVAPPETLSPYSLGTAYIAGFCYLSLQTILSKHGLINQYPRVITLIGSRSRSFSIAGNSYLCQKMAPKYLNNLEGIELYRSFPIATIERAIVDMLYYNQNFYFDQDISPYLDRVREIQQQVFNKNI